jgi:hypothetical protein
MLSLPPPLIHDAIFSLAADFADYAIDAAFIFTLLFFAMIRHFLSFLITPYLLFHYYSPRYCHAIIFSFSPCHFSARCHLITPRHYAIIAISPLIIDIFIIYFIRCHYAILR